MRQSHTGSMLHTYGITRLETRLGPLAWRSSGRGPTRRLLRRRAGERRPVARRRRRARGPLPLHHARPAARRASLAAVPGADRSAGSLARLHARLPELLDVDDATVVANDTAGGLLLLSLATGHPALARVGRLVLTNCESYDQFPPDALSKAAALCRRLPRLARALLRLQLRSSAARRRIAAGVAATGLDAGAHGRRSSRRHGAIRRMAGDLVAAMAGFRPQLLIDAAAAIPRFDRPVLLVWGDACDFFAARTARHDWRPSSPTRRWFRFPAPRPGCRSTLPPRSATPSLRCAPVM